MYTNFTIYGFCLTEKTTVKGLTTLDEKMSCSKNISEAFVLVRQLNGGSPKNPWESSSVSNWICDISFIGNSLLYVKLSWWVSCCWNRFRVWSGHSFCWCCWRRLVSCRSPWRQVGLSWWMLRPPQHPHHRLISMNISSRKNTPLKMRIIRPCPIPI